MTPRWCAKRTALSTSHEDAEVPRERIGRAEAALDSSARSHQRAPLDAGDPLHHDQRHAVRGEPTSWTGTTLGCSSVPVTHASRSSASAASRVALLRAS